MAKVNWMFIFLDTETTGTDEEDRLCQLAYKTEDGTVVDELFNPVKAISIDAMSIHHVTNDRVKDKPFFKDSETKKNLDKLIEKSDNIKVTIYWYLTTQNSMRECSKERVFIQKKWFARLNWPGTWTKTALYRNSIYSILDIILISRLKLLRMTPPGMCWF